MLGQVILGKYKVSMILHPGTPQETLELMDFGLAKLKGFIVSLLLCETLGVSTSGFSAWASREPSAAQKRRDALVVEIRAVPADVKGRYGSPRVHAELQAKGVECCLNTVAQLMADNDIRAQTARKSRDIILIADAAYACRGVLEGLPGRVPFVGRMRGDAAAYDPTVPPQPAGQRGPKPKKGPRLPSPRAAAQQADQGRDGPGPWA